MMNRRAQESGSGCCLFRNGLPSSSRTAGTTIRSKLPRFPAEQKAMIIPLKCCGGFKILHAIQPRVPPAMNVIPMLIGINHLSENVTVFARLANMRDGAKTVKTTLFNI